MNSTFRLLLIFPRTIGLYLILIAISIVAFYFFKRLVHRFIKIDRHKTLVAFISTILIIPVFYIAFLFYFTSYGESIIFDKSKWEGSHVSRFKMANDIIDSGMLIDKDSNQVKQILGIPDSRNPTIPSWYYNMGWSSGGLGFLQHNLAVKIENNKVSKVVQFLVMD